MTGSSDTPTAPETPHPDGWVTLAIAAGFVVAIGLFYRGLTEPAIRIGQIFSEDMLSIMDGIATFYETGQPALGTLVLVVSVIFPAVKIALSLTLLWRMRPDNRLTRALMGSLSYLSKWSMTDVFILAVTVLVIDGRVLTTADLAPGAWYYFFAVILSTALSHLMVWRSDRLRALAARAG